LLQDSFRELDSLGLYLLNNPEKRIMLEGHTDNQGSREGLLLLSDERVKTVKNYLVSKGVSAQNIQTIGYGGIRPVAPNDTEENRRKNRRVEVKIF
jgi:outer membrane protein OmpA-like peptidoglycan-associated protein